MCFFLCEDFSVSPYWSNLRASCLFGVINGENVVSYMSTT